MLKNSGFFAVSPNFIFKHAVFYAFSMQKSTFRAYSALKIPKNYIQIT
jgi:hypothetical protein